MPQEQALRQARQRIGPRGRREGGSDSWRARLEQSSALIAPATLLLGLALAGGGFSLTPRHVAGLAVWLLLVGMLALGAAGRATLGRPFYWTSGLIAGVALFSGISSLWSGSIELTVIEAGFLAGLVRAPSSYDPITKPEQSRGRFTQVLDRLVQVGLITQLDREQVEATFVLPEGGSLRHFESMGL